MLLRTAAIIGAVLVILLAVGWLGFRIQSPAFAPLEAPTAPTMIPIPTGLPEPVQRYVEALFGETMPQVQTAVVSGHATITLNGLTMPARMRFYYDVQRGHYHDIQVTWFGQPVMKVHERFLDGHAILDIPIIGRTENDPTTDAASNQGFWAETLGWVPALVFGDPRVQWEAIDATHARLIVPNATDDVEHFTLTFDAETGLPTQLDTQRYPNNTGRQRWSGTFDAWGEVDGQRVAVNTELRWEDNPPWAVWQVEEVVLNPDVSARLSRFGD